MNTSKDIKDVITLIKRRIDNYTGTNDTYDRVRRYELEELLTIINHADPVQEPPVNLDKEIDKTVNECTNGYEFDWDQFARHFYELGKRNATLL